MPVEKGDKKGRLCGNKDVLPKVVTRPNISSSSSVSNMSVGNKKVVVSSQKRCRPITAIMEETTVEDTVADLGEGDTLGNNYALQEMSMFEWRLPQFMKYYNRYLDNESKHLDELEATAVRTYLLRTGNVIKLPAVFLSNLYLTPCDESDQNQNEESTANLNVAEGARSMAKPSDILGALMTINFKLVEDSGTEEPTRLHFNVNVVTSSGKTVASIVHMLTSVKLGYSRSVACQLQKKHFSLFTLDDDAIITVRSYVYRPPKEWGMTPKDVNLLNDFMLVGEISSRDKKRVDEIAQQCHQHRLYGIVDCLNNLSIIPHSFFED